MDSGILSAIGNTPLIRLERLFGDSGLEVYAKLELLNPGGSAKDRPALRMIQEAWRDGLIDQESNIIESSSGNMAISMALICKYMGMRFISVIDPKTTANNIRILRAAGAEIDYVAEPDPQTGEYLPARLQRVQQLLADLPGSVWLNQYANPNNYMAHYETTMPEITKQLGQVDYVFSGVSTCGTIRGCAEYVKDSAMATKIIAVDAEGSAIFGGNNRHAEIAVPGPVISELSDTVDGFGSSRRAPVGKNGASSGGISLPQRRFPGLGAGIVPPFCKPELIDQVVHVSDWEMVLGCRALAHQESILAGASSGAVIAAVRQLQPEMPAGSRCAVILHDRGERYMDTVYSEEWVQAQFGRAIPGQLMEWLAINGQRSIIPNQLS